MFLLPLAMYQEHSLKEGLPMKIEKYLLVILVVFFLIVIGTYLHKMVH
jgi:hypothetical protein